MLGTRIRAPILVAPTAMHRFFTADGELATARAAADVGTVYVVSMAATHSVEDVAAVAPAAPRWTQMYMLRDRGRTRALAERAAAAGYTAIVASVDGAAVGRGIASASAGRLTPPDWMRYPNLASDDDTDSSDIMRLVSDFDPSLTFDDLALFGEWSGLPVRGEGRAAGRRRRRVRRRRRGRDRGVEPRRPRARRHRRDRRRPPDVVDAVSGRAKVYVDGGIRTGVDVVKALALGARAVMVGRPVLWGLCVDGTAGAARCSTLLGTEFEAALAFCGAATPDDLTRDLVAPRPG